MCYLVAHVWSTRAWWARVLYKVPEPTQLEYQAGETSHWWGLGSLPTQFPQLGTRAWWARVLCKVPEPTKLEYFTRGPLSNTWVLWPTKLLIFFFVLLRIVGFKALFLNFFFFYLYNVAHVLFLVFCFFFFFHSGPTMWKTFFINSLFFNFYFFYLYNM